MSKYNKLPGLPDDSCDEKKTKMAISKLCCLPILMDNSAYKKQLSGLLSLEELLPMVQRNEIYQMLYMDELLNQLREYEPPEQYRDSKSPIDIIMEHQSNNPSFKAIRALMTYNRTGDFSQFFGLLFPGNPMLSMLLPMLGEKRNGVGGMESLLPVLMGNAGGNMDMGMLSSLLGNLS